MHPELGKLLTGGEQRDAIHIAIMPVTSSENWLAPGEKIKFIYGSNTIVASAYHSEDAIGVVDPFLEDGIAPGQKFYMFLLPNTITGLRHEWTHPGVDNQPVHTNPSELWLRQFADRWNFNYSEMIEAASGPIDDRWGNYITAQGRDIHSASELGEDHDLFWHHIEVLTGKHFSPEHRNKVGWSCSC